MKLTALQMDRLRDVQLDMDACQANIQRKVEDAEAGERGCVTLSDAEAWAALNVMAFVRSLLP